jgi:ribonuclease HI
MRDLARLEMNHGYVPRDRSGLPSPFDAVLDSNEGWFPSYFHTATELAIHMNPSHQSNGSIVVFTDGAAKGNPGPGGWAAVIVGPEGRVREFGGGSPHTTNNRMELTGPIEALAHLRTTSGRVAVYTDSTYVIRGISEWIPSWQRRGWRTIDGKEVLNRELWEQLWTLVRDRAGGVEWHYVRGHIGIPGNERVDEIANAFAMQIAPKLYDGPVSEYSIQVLDIPADTRLPQISGNKSPDSKSSKKPFSYVSVVDGVARRHSNWTECEQRVKGRSGARFKKAMSAADEAAILKAWGVHL